MKLGFFSLLTILFVIFKVFNIITWSWLLVFSPLIVGVVFWILAVILMVVLKILADDYK